MLFITLGLAFTTNAYSQGVKVNASNNAELQQALENPDVSSILITQDGYYEALSNTASAGDVIVKSGNGIMSTCTLSISRDNECWGDANTSHFATASTSGDPSCPTQPVGSLGWSYDAGAAPGTLTFDLGAMGNLQNYDAEFTVSTAGQYELTYTWDATNSATINVFLYDTPTVIFDADDTGCETVDIDWEYDFGYQVGVTSTVTMTVTDANSTTVDITPTTIFVDGATGTITFNPADYSGQGLWQCGEYTLNVYAYNSLTPPCTFSDSETFYIYDTPNANAGTDQEVCEDAVDGYYTMLDGSYATLSCTNSTTPTVEWTEATGNPSTATFSSTSSDTPTVTVTACGSYDFIYTVTNGDCVDSDTVNVYFYDLPTGVSAGADQEVCEDLTNGFEASLTGTHNSLSCDNGGGATYDWTKVSGPGTITFATADAASTTVTASACGSYELAFWVSNGGDCTVSSTMTLDFYALPDNVTATSAEKVCGFTTDLVGDYSQDCSGTLGDPTFAWTYTGTGTATFSPDNTSLSPSVTVDDCGEYTFTLTVTNITGCETVSSTTSEFYETPDPVINGDDEVYACDSVTYTVTETTCNDPSEMTYSWSVTGGVFEGSVTQTTGTSVVVIWDYDHTTDGTLNVTASVDPLLTACEVDAIELVVDKMQPTFEGQIRYWNSAETFMPTPFPTDNYSTYPQDYFYVTLYGGLTSQDSIETAIVEPNLLLSSSGTDSTLMSYFGFDLPLAQYGGCEANFSVKVWDGGLVYHTTPAPPAENTVLGNNYTWNNFGGVNATDAYAIQLMAASVDINGSPYNYTWVAPSTGMTTAYGFYSADIADVNTSSGITALDALIANYRGTGILSNYPNAGSNMFSPNYTVAGRMVTTLPEETWSDYFDATYGNWTDVAFTHSGNEYMYFQPAVNHKYTSANIPWEADANFMNIYYEVEGDINASYVPTSTGFKAQSAIDLVYENEVGTHIDQVMTIPVSIDNAADLNAISLYMNFRNDLIEVIETNFAADFVNINNEEGILNIGWFSEESKAVATDEAIALIKVRVIAEIPSNTELFELQAGTELADADAQPISDITLKTIGVTTDKVQASTSDLMSSNYPNPFSKSTTIEYTLPETGKVQIAILNSMGTVVETLVEEVQEAGAHNFVYNTDARPGVYFYSITLQGENDTYSTVKRMIVVN